MSDAVARVRSELTDLQERARRLRREFLDDPDGPAFGELVSNLNRQAVVRSVIKAGAARCEWWGLR